MTLVIVVILLIAYVLIATELLTKVNKAAVAVFAGTVGWILYICYGTDFVMSQHPNDYFDFLSGAVPTSSVVKEYIAQNVFLKYVGRGAEIVLFLLATMTIVEILHNNGCFDFVSQLLKTRRSRRLLPLFRRGHSAGSQLWRSTHRNRRPHGPLPLEHGPRYPHRLFVGDGVALPHGLAAAHLVDRQKPARND